MRIEAIRTHRVEPGESLEAIFDRYLEAISEKTILVITSKIISLCQGRILSKASISKEALIRQEADAVIQAPESPYGITLTLKNNALIPSAGIDESNGNGVYILYPEQIQKTTAALWTYLRKSHAIEHLGIIITDSHTTPLRRGVTGIALGWCGFSPLYSYVGKPDLYGNPLRVTQINLLDGLASAAVVVMGEGNEQTPLAMIHNAPKVSFLSQPPSPEEEESITISLEEDLYAPLLKGVRWVSKSPP